MKVLVICNKYPDPPKDGGSLATYNIASGLAKEGIIVDILAMNTSKHYSIKAKSGLKPEWVNSITAVETDNTITNSAVLKNWIFSTLPFNAELYNTSLFKSALVEILSKNRFDFIQMEGLYMSVYIPVIKALSNAKIAYRAHNIEHKIWEGCKKSEKNLLKRLYFKSLASRIKKFETGVINSYDLLLAITGNDLMQFELMGNTKTSIVVPFGIFPSPITNKQNSRRDVTISFLGALDWIPNIEGLSWFVDSVWPKLRSKHPGLKFKVAGRNGNKQLKERLISKGVDYIGEVDDSSIFFAASDILIVPLFSGSGIRVKIIEAMFAGKAVVATNHAAAGIESGFENHILIADSEIKFFESVDKLVVNSDIAESLGSSARVFALDNYDNNQISVNLAGFYRRNMI